MQAAQHNENEPARPRAGTWLALPAGALVLTVLVLGFAALSGGCTSLAKSELEVRLAELPKNEPLGAYGLQRTSIVWQHAGKQREDELVYLHIPRDPAAGGPVPAPVVLVHGTPSTLYTWTELALGGPGFRGLSAERDVYLLEIIGHGVAPGRIEPLTFQACADFVAAAVRALGLEPAHLVGQSYGGEFAWRAALDQPELFASLTVMDSSGYTRADGDWLPEEVQMRENGLADYGYLLNSRERIGVALQPHFDEVPPDRGEEFFLVCENRVNWIGMVDLAQDENGEREDEIARIAVPTLVLWGADDVAYALDTYGRRFAADIPGAELVALEGVGHYPHEQRPGEVAEVLQDFFTRLETAR